MPRENKKRGRRMERDSKKRKYDDEDGQQPGESNKRRRSTDEAATNEDFIPLQSIEDYPKENTDEQSSDRPFYGLLDDDEQEFFRHAGETLDDNSFSEPEDKQAFLTNVFKEADGKELKLANSQSCSRVFEKLLHQATPAQCKHVFGKFAGNYNHLMTHRFASHVLETLFTRAAPFVSDEVKHGITSDEGSLEDCFLSVLSEIEGNVGYLITDQYASHVLRNILLIVAGEPLSKEALKTLRSKKKESIKKHEEEESKDKEKVKLRTVPESFKKALEKLIAESMAGLPTDKLRALATHPNANPTLQLLLRLELSHLGKQRAKEETSVIRTLLPDEPITEDCDSTSFINGMVYDPVGSHLVETVVQAAPAKLFKNLYKVIFHDRIASYARNEIASHIACRVLERLGQDDLLEMHEVLIPHICDLLRKNKTNVVRTLIERCAVREIDTKVIALQVNDTWSTPDGFEIRKLIKTAKVPIKAEDDENPAPELTEQELSEINVSESVKTHFNLLAQAMLLVPGALSALVLESMITLGAKELFELAFDPIVSRTIQTALTTRVTSIITTRKLVQAFYGQIGEMSLDKSASHVVDCVWEGTHGLAFIRERIAEELAENEADLRNSPFGRAVWKNWKMDIYKRRRSEWVRQSKIKASNDGFQSFSELDERKKQNGEQKTPLQLARERHARDKKAKQEAEAKEKETNGRPSSAGSGDGAAPAMAAAA